jgi:hypothetical protein
MILGGMRKSACGEPGKLATNSTETYTHVMHMDHLPLGFDGHITINMHFKVAGTGCCIMSGTGFWGAAILLRHSHIADSDGQPKRPGSSPCSRPLKLRFWIRDLHPI